MGIEGFNVRKTNIKLYPGYDCGAVSLQNETLLTIGNAKKGGALNAQFLKNRNDNPVDGAWRYFTSNKLLNHNKMVDYYKQNLPILKFRDVKFNQNSGAGLSTDNKLYVWGNIDLGGGFNLDKDQPSKIK